MSLSRRYLARVILVFGIPGLLWPWILLAVGRYRSTVEIVEEGIPFTRSAFSQLGTMESWWVWDGKECGGVYVNVEYDSNMMYDILDRTGDWTPDLLLITSEGSHSDPAKRYLRFRYEKSLGDGGCTKGPTVFALGDHRVPGTVWQYTDIDSDGLVDVRTPCDASWRPFAAGDIFFDYEWVPVQRELGADGVPIYRDMAGARAFRREDGRWVVVDQN